MIQSDYIILVDSQEESIQIQNLLFDLGYSWRNGDKTPFAPYWPALTVTRLSMQLSGWSDIADFTRVKGKLIAPHDFSNYEVLTAKQFLILIKTSLI